MRELIIYYIRESKWYSNYLDESEGVGKNFDALPDTTLIEIYNHVMTH